MSKAAFLFIGFAALVTLRITGVLTGIVPELAALVLLIGAIAAAVRAGKQGESVHDDHTKADVLAEQRRLDEKANMQ